MFDPMGERLSLLRLCVLFGAHLFGTGASAQERSAAEAQLPPMESVLRVSTADGEGSGFLADSTGLIVTNAHVTAGRSAVEVQLDDRYKVDGLVIFEDRASDIALVRVHADAVEGIPALAPSAEAFEELEVGHPILVVGFPLGVGRTLTRGIVSRKTSRTILTDASVNPGNSGGPMFDARGRVVGVASFGVSQSGGPGLGGGVSASQTVASIGTADLASLPASLPSSDSLPVMPLDPFPIAELHAAREADDWPLELYDISSDENRITSRFEVRLFTPLVQQFLDRQASVRATTVGGEELVFAEDLRYWALDLGAYSPVVIVRITPKIGQSAWGFWGNLLGTLAGGYYRPIDDPEFLGSVTDAALWDRNPVRSIHTRLTWSVINGQAAQAAYLVIDPRVLCSESGIRTAWQIVIATEDRFSATFPIRGDAHGQVCSDFAGYLAEVP